MGFDIYNDFYIENWRTFKKWLFYSNIIGAVSMSALPLYFVIRLLQDGRFFYIAKIHEQLGYLALVSMYVSIGIRYFRLEAIIDAARKRNKHLLVNRIKYIMIISLIHTIASAAAGIYVASVVPNLNLIVFFEIMIIFAFFYSVPRLYHIEDWLTYAEFPFFL